MKKTFSFIFIILLVVNLIGCNTTINDSQNQDNNNLLSIEYAETLFDTSFVHEINVEISEDDWIDLLENPTEKTKYSTTVTLDGTEVNEVSFATKGNTSLSQVANTNSERYSFKIKFDKFIDGQTYDGLDTLHLNNLYSDATYLKDYLSYRIMAESGVASPLVSFVALSINNEYYGLYIAIEEIGDSFLTRNYGEDSGNLYKPESSQFENMGVAGDMDKNFPSSGEMQIPDGADRQMPDDTDRQMPDDNKQGIIGEDKFMFPEDGDFNIPDRNGMEGGGFSGNSNGSSLVYTDDEITSYSDIFDNSKTNSDEEDNQRVIASLKQLSTGENLEEVLDVEAILRYFVAHNFVINYDSYTGNMLHNYYLYEENGVLTMLPWDYNLAFGGFNSSNSTEAVNWPIDSPLLSNSLEDERPMWSMLAINNTYLEIYHTYFDDLLTNYFENNRFLEEINTLYNLIRPYVETDPTAFYTVEQFDIAVETLKSFCLLRSESIRGQLNGTIPSDSESQQENTSELIDAEEINLQDMGSMSVGRGQEENRNRRDMR